MTEQFDSIHVINVNVFVIYTADRESNVVLHPNPAIVSSLAAAEIKC